MAHRKLAWLFHEPHTGLDDCLSMLQAYFREMMSASNTAIGVQGDPSPPNSLWDIQNPSQPNPGPRGDGSPCRGFRKRRTSQKDLLSFHYSIPFHAVIRRAKVVAQVHPGDPRGAHQGGDEGALRGHLRGQPAPPDRLALQRRGAPGTTTTFNAISLRRRLVMMLVLKSLSLLE